MSNKIKVTKGVKRRSAVEQALLIRQDVLAITASANSIVATERQVSDASAIEVVWRALNETRHFSSFSSRTNYAFSQLKSFIDLAQGQVSYSAVTKYSDLLSVAHPFSSVPHAMTASAFEDAQMQWYLADPRISQEHAPLIASAFSTESTEEQRRYATVRLTSTKDGAEALKTITAAFSGDGNSYINRSRRALAQLRDRLGRFAYQGGGMRAPVRTTSGVTRWLTGRTVGADIASNSFDIETPLGIVRVPASSAESLKAYLPGKNKDGYSVSDARLTAEDNDDITEEANLQFVDSPADWESVDNFQGNEGEKAFTDGVYTVAQRTNEDGSKSYRLIDENDNEVAKAGTWADTLAERDKDALGGVEPSNEVTEDRLLSGLDEIADNETAGSFREVASNIANFLRDGTAPSDRTPEQLAEQAKDLANALVDPNEKSFDKKFEGFEEDFRLGSEAILKKLDGQQIGQERSQPIAKLPIETSAPTAEIPRGAYEIDRGEFTPSGRTSETSTDYTDDPEVLANKFTPSQIAKALTDALLGDNPNRVNGYGSGPLEFNEGIEEVSAEALYQTLKKQGKSADKFVDDTYVNGQARLDKETETDAEADEPDEIIDEVEGEDVADAFDRVKGKQPLDEVNTAEEEQEEQDPNHPALIDGLTEEEQQAWVDSGFDHVPFLPKNEEINFPEGYAEIDLNPVALNEITTVEEGDVNNQNGFPVGWTDDPYVIAQNYDTDDLITDLEASLIPRAEGDEIELGSALFTEEDENGDKFESQISFRNIRDALQLQGEDTNALLRDFADRAWASEADNKPTASDVEEGRSSGDPTDEEIASMMDGEGITEEPSITEVIADRARGIQPGGGLTIDTLDGSEPTEGFAVARQGFNKELNFDEFMSDPEKYIYDYLDENKDVLSEDNVYLGFWHDEENNEMVLDVSEVFSDREAGIQAGIDRNQQAIYDIGSNEVVNTGGTGDREEATENQPSEATEETQPDDGRGTEGVREGSRTGVQEEGREPTGQVSPALFDKSLRIDGSFIDSDGTPRAGHEVLTETMSLGIWGPNTETNLPTKANIVKYDAPVTAMQPGDVTIDNAFTVTEIGEPNSRGAVRVRGYYPGHQVEERFLGKNTVVGFLRGLSEKDMPSAGDLPSFTKPRPENFTGGGDSQEFKLAYAQWRGLLNAARGRWSNRPAVGSNEFDASVDIHRVKVHANELKPGDVMADPTKGNFVVVSVFDPSPDNPEHADAITEGRIIVTGYYPGHELQEKQWKPRQQGRNGRQYKMDVIRNSNIPESGPLPEIKAGETVDGVYVRNTDPQFVKELNIKYSQAASRYEFPSDAVETDYLQEVNPSLRAVPTPTPASTAPASEPKKPFEPSDPFAQGDFAQMLREAGSWQALREAMQGRTITFFDYETTGLDHNTEKPVQLGAVKIRDGVVVDRFNMYMNPDKTLSDWSKKNLRNADGELLTDEFLQQQVSLEEAHQAFAEWTGQDSILGAQNSKFDRRFLETTLANTGVDFTPTGYLDIMALAKAINVDAGVPRKSVSLKNLAEEYEVPLEGWHSADVDAETASAIFQKLLQRAEAENLATGLFDVDRMQIESEEAETLYNEITYPNYVRRLEEWTAAKAVADALAGKEISVEQLEQSIPKGPSQAEGQVDPPTGSTPATKRDSRLATTEWATDPANTVEIPRGDVRFRELVSGDFMTSASGNIYQILDTSDDEDFVASIGGRPGQTAVYRVSTETGEGHWYTQFGGSRQLDGIRKPRSYDSLAFGEDIGDSSLTRASSSDQEGPTLLEHETGVASDYSAETVITKGDDNSLTADTKVFDNDGDLIAEKTAPVDSVEDAQKFGDDTLEELRQEINSLIEDLMSSNPPEEPTTEEIPSETLNIIYPTQRSVFDVTDKDGVAHQISVVQLPSRFGGGFELGVFKDDGSGNWEEAEERFPFQNFENIESALEAAEIVKSELTPTPVVPRKPTRSKKQKQEAKRGRIQEGAYLIYQSVDGEESYVWRNPDGSSIPLDENDPEQAGDLSIGRVFGQPNSRVIEGGEAIRDALSAIEIDETVDTQPEIREIGGGFSPAGTPMLGRVVRPAGRIETNEVSDPSGRKFNVELQLEGGFEGDPEHFNVIIRDPAQGNREIAYEVATSREEADELYGITIAGIDDGTTVIAESAYGQDILDTYGSFDPNRPPSPSDSTPYVTTDMLPSEESARYRLIGNKLWQKYSNEMFLYADGTHQARVGDRVVHQYTGWRKLLGRDRGAGTIRNWEIIANPGDKARVGYAYVTFDDGSWGVFSTDFLFLEGRSTDTANPVNSPPVSAEAMAMEPPLPNIKLPFQTDNRQLGRESTVRRLETEEKYTLELRTGGDRGGGGRERTFITTVIPYVSTNRKNAPGLLRGVARTRAAYDLWLERQGRVADYREAMGLPRLTSRVVTLQNPGDRIKAPIWRRATGLGGGEEAPATPQVPVSISTPAPIVTPNAPEISSNEPRTRTQEIDDFVNGFNSTPENSSNQLSVENPNIDFVFISDDTNPNNSVGIEWAEDNQEWSIQVVNGNTPEELRYNTDLNEAGAYATTRLLELREGNITPTAPSPEDVQAEILRGSELRNFVEEFNNDPNNRPVIATKVAHIVILKDESTGKTARVRWNQSDNSWALQTSDGDKYYLNISEVIEPAKAYFLDNTVISSQDEVLEPTGLATLPQNPLTPAQRFLNRSIDRLFPVSGGTGTGRLKGVIYKNFDAVDPNSTKNQNNQPLTQQDFVANGHQSVRAAELAHAANNRPSADYIQSIFKEYNDFAYGTIERKEAKEKLKEAIKEVFGEGNQFGSGRVIVNSVEPSGDYIEIKMSILNSNGLGSGFANRDLHFKDGKLHYSYNDHLKINESSQVKGFSSPFNSFMERWYEANGAEYVDVHAFSNSGEYIGGYIWALDGFNWKDQNIAKSNVSKAIKKALESSNPNVVEDAKKFMDAIESLTGATSLFDIPGGSGDPIVGFPTPLEIAMIGYRPGDTRWWGQSYLKSAQGNWNGRKHLNATAPNVLQTFGYQDLRRAREMAERGQNAVTSNSWLNKLMKTTETYFGDGEILSLYADEYSRFFKGLQPKSVALLSPPAKEALGKYVATILGNSSYLSQGNTARSRDADVANTELLISIQDALNKDKMAYQPNQSSLSARGKELAQMPVSTFSEITGKDISLFFDGKDTGFVVSRLGRDTSNAEGPVIGGPPSGASSSWKVVDSRTGEAFIIKDVGDYKAMSSEVAVNALGRALEIQGLPVVESFATDPEYIISSEAGTHLRISKLDLEELQPVEGSRGLFQPVADTPYLIRAGESANFRDPEIAASELSQVGIINMAIMDIATGNADRNESNTIMVRNHKLDGVDAPAESWIPIPIDHTETLIRYATDSTIEDYIINSQGDSMDWATGLFDKVGPVTFKMMMEKRARIALDNIRQQYGPFMSQQDYETISQRLQGIIDLSADNLEDLMKRRR